MVCLNLHFFDKSLWKETEISRGIPITFSLSMFSPITLAFFGIYIRWFYSIETQKKCVAFCWHTAGVALWGLPVGIFYHLIKLKVQGFSICVLISLNYMNLGGLWLRFFSFLLHVSVVKLLQYWNGKFIQLPAVKWIKL